MTNISFYADFRGLAALKNDAKSESPAALQEAARQFESLFTQMLLKSMREASKSFGDSLFGSDQADFYQGMFDDQMAVQLSAGRGLGLAEMLVQQLKGRTAEPDQGTAQGAASTSSALASPTANRQPPTASFSASKQDFVRSLWPDAERAGREVGVDPHALLAQAALETGWGRSVPCNAQGDCSFNLFGIKAGAHWPGATVNVPTLEYEAGIPVRRVERFRSYESAAQSFRDYAGLIRNNPRYAAALGTGNDVASFASALQQGGYATDPQYAQKIAGVAQEVRALLRDAPLKSGVPGPLTMNGSVGP